MGVVSVVDINYVDVVWEGGFGYQLQIIWNGQCFSVVRVFFDLVCEWFNLMVMIVIDVQCIEFQECCVVVVQVCGVGGVQCFVVCCEVLLCVGVIELFKLFQLLGVGLGELLCLLGIVLVYEVFEVGCNLCEYVYVVVQYWVICGSFNYCFRGFGLLCLLLCYFLFSKGLMIYVVYEVGGFVKICVGLECFDVQIGVSLYFMDGDGKMVMIDKQLGVILGGYFMYLQSCGEVCIQFSDFVQLLLIVVNYFSVEEDQVVGIVLLCWICCLVVQLVFKLYIVEELMFGLQVQSDVDIFVVLCCFGQIVFYVVGICCMGCDLDVVLDL